MKQFFHRNEGFVCQNCGQKVSAAPQTCRNHCTACLFSLHVDENPGDRSHDCLGLMKPVRVEHKNGAFTRLWHRCTRCQAEKPNKVAPDDEKEALWKVFGG